MGEPNAERPEADELHRIGDLIDEAIHRSGAIEQPRPAFMSGRWHRRSGDIYQRVAEPHSPNSLGVGHGND
jgi:hypothetical protein